MINNRIQKEVTASIWITCIFVAIVCEGALRKWLLPAPLHPAAFLAKDLLGICYIAVHRNDAGSKYKSTLTLLSYSAVGLLFISFILGMGNSWQSAIITYKNAVLWPLIAACNCQWQLSEAYRESERQGHFPTSPVCLNLPYLALFCACTVF